MTTPSSQQTRDPVAPTRVCIVGASGKLGRYLVRPCLDRGHAHAGQEHVA